MSSEKFNKLASSMNDKINDKIDDKVSLTSPMANIMFFFTISAIFGLFNVYYIYSKGSLDSIRESKNNNIFILIYIGLLLLGSYFINVNISKTLCVTNQINWSNILFITLVPWTIIFGLLYFILDIFTGWVNPFSNTIGYVIVSALGATDIIKSIFRSSEDNNEKSLKTALINIEKNYSKIINEFDLELPEFLSYITQFKNEGFLNSSVSKNLEFDENIIKIYQHVNVKFFLGKLVWYMLAGILISSITYNFILNIKCEKTSEETSKAYDELHKKSSYVPVYGKKWQKLSSKGDKTNLSESSQFIELIDKYSERFIENIDDEIEFSKRELRFVGIMNELPQNMCIEINGDYYMPTE